MEITLKTNNAQQDKYLMALIKSLEELGITIKRDNDTKKNNGKAVVAMLRKIAAKGGIEAIPDPMKWQRQIRKDRKLPR